MTENIPGEDTSFVYQVVPDEPVVCLICEAKEPADELVILSCTHKICKTCMLEYLDYAKNNFKLYPLKCPDSNCEEDVFKSYKSLLRKNIYKKLKSIRATNKLMRVKDLVWCNGTNCGGFAIVKNTSSADCNKCGMRLYLVRDSEKDSMIQEFSLVECPGCGMLITRELLCMKIKCLCGAEFCVKCKKHGPKHRELVCAVSSTYGKFSWLAIVSAIYAYILFPFFLPIFMIIYDNYWAKLYIFKEKRSLKIFAIFLFSPLLEVLAVIVLSGWMGWMCVEVLFDWKNARIGFSLVKSMIIVGVVPLVFCLELLVISLAILIMPLFGFYMLIKTVF